MNFIRSWKQYTILQLATLSILSLSFTMIVLSLIVSKNINSALKSWGDNIKISVFLDESTTSEQSEQLKQKISRIKIIENIKYVSRAEAKENFKKRMKHTLPDLYTDTDTGNPFPASYEVTIKSALNNYSAIGKIIEGFADKISKEEIVEDVIYGKSWVNNYSSLIAVFSKSSVFLIAVLILGSMFVISNSIKSSIHHRKEEVEIMELFGATKSMIRTPYVVEGAIMSMLAMALALGCAFMLFQWQSKLLLEGLGFWNFLKEVSFLNVNHIVVLMLTASIVGAFSSYLCVRTISNGWSAAEGMSES